ncbi:hypothetical protein VF04_04135 [Nostoc linckia z7]|uniref:Restriction endonuclease n=2 Tax=Nostoc linckia TaxID=92942 RepID=A0A9Q5ZG12_NOSLI|nr:restriction endonuclease [Nostoc linckia]PHK42902.1 hypothetical protein VF12_00835 [Nostoc linckia z15]PHK48059.1 hypothetical protein VF13_01810 [Nostoc linckia z16]PHJ64979.1 hypothetical protein VF02_11620 [Nostoc linckia z1]PHJ70157.1 hypothetical protein VF05_11780 [Nostoc linckia z3]PHJ75058.1 hypothetical protein VF03_11940 [Nostoc linckia z2]
MHPSQFVELAGFPERWQEKHLQKYLAERLQEQGYGVKLEAGANGGRADIVSDWMDGAIIEVKKYLDRNTIYQAVGQLNLYGLGNKRKLVVMGFLTSEAREQKSAFTTASMVQQDPRVKVVFVNLEKEWQPGYKTATSWLRIPKFQVPPLSLPQLPKIKLQWLFELVKSHPILLALAIVVFLSTIPIPKPRQNNQLKQNGINNTFMHSSERNILPVELISEPELEVEKSYADLESGDDKRHNNQSNGTENSVYNLNKLLDSV